MNISDKTRIRRTRQVMLAISIGVFTLVLFGWGVTTLNHVLFADYTINHHGIVESKFMAVSSGTTIYHLLVNESGVVVDVTTDAVTWYNGSKIGTEFTWETNSGPDPGLLIASLASVLGFFPGSVTVIALLFPPEEKKSGSMSS